LNERRFIQQQLEDFASEQRFSSSLSKIGRQKMEDC